MANIELDGLNKKIKVDSGDLTLDVPGDIVLDADGGDITFADGGTNLLKITNSSSDVVFQPQVDTKDIVFKQYDGTVVATVEDNATFNVPTGKLAINGTAITSTAAELNILDGVTATAAELNLIDGVTATTAELNILDGVTATAAEINLIDGGTARGTTAIADGDGVLINDAGTMRMTNVTTLKTYIGGGLSETETWRVTTGANVSAGSAFFTSNWEQDDTYGAVDVGTGMTESSGVFSFPSTGIYEINFTVGFINDNGGNQAKYLVSEIHLTTDNSSYNKAAEAINSNAPEASSIYSFATTSCLFDVTNTTNDKAKFAYNVQQNFAYTGNTNYNATFVTFKRLGDT